MSRTYQQQQRHASVTRLSERRRVRRIVGKVKLARALTERVLAVLFPQPEGGAR